MKKSDMSFRMWLELGEHVEDFPDLRQLWLELLLSTVVNAGHGPIPHRYTGFRHNLTFEEVLPLLEGLSPHTLEHTSRRNEILSGASPQLVEQFLEYGVRARQHWCGFKHEFATTWRDYRLPEDFHRTLGFLGANPRLTRAALRPLLEAEVIDEKVLATVLTTSHKANVVRSPAPSGGMNALATARAIFEHLREDPGAWRLFFELWDGETTIGDALATARATL